MSAPQTQTDGAYLGHTLDLISICSPRPMWVSSNALSELFCLAMHRPTCTLRLVDNKGALAAARLSYGTVIDCLLSLSSSLSSSSSSSPLSSTSSSSSSSAAAAEAEAVIIVL